MTREVLEECYAEVDAISLHRYFGLFDKAVTDDTSRFLAQNLDMERQIDEVAGVCDYVRARLRSEKRLWLSFDEWNVWYRETTVRGDRTEAPRLLEEKYDLGIRHRGFAIPGWHLPGNTHRCRILVDRLRRAVWNRTLGVKTLTL